MTVTTQSLRQQWLSFWKDRQHAVIPSAGLVPENDPSALFYNSGMHPLVPYLMGEPHPLGVRLVNVQKCIRTGDIEEVGDRTHLTFFEMLGNWSLGDFFKKEQITWSYEFLIDVLNIPQEKLAVSVFEGDDNAPRDEESAQYWQDTGMPVQRIAYLPASENWWAKGETGPCGPDSEMFYWTGSLDDPILQKPYQETWEDPRWVEIWNDVFMQFNKKPDGTLEKLPAQNVDTGMGLERTVAILNGYTSVYQTDAFASILEKIAELSGFTDLATNPLGETSQHNSGRIIADHLRSSVTICADGISPGNVDQGYILRRLLRRAIRHGRQLGMQRGFVGLVAQVVIDNLGTAYPEIRENSQRVLSELKQEEEQFGQTLDKGVREFQKVVDTLSGKKISGETAFDLYQTYGFPLEITVEMAAEKDLTVDEDGFKTAYESHQKQSRTASAGKFKGGLSRENIEDETRLHTATHLLLAGLRSVLGEHVHQAGSNITAERLRFDFTHDQKLTDEEKQAIEDYVNQAIAADAQQKLEQVDKEAARVDKTIEASFWEKYPDTVKVYTFVDATGRVWTRELCGGPHVESTRELGTFKIKKEEASSRGVRRIKAVLVSL